MSEATISSHMPILRWLLDQYPADPDEGARIAVEFGMGEYSTPLLWETCELVISIEMNSPEWFMAITSHASNNLSVFLGDSIPYECKKWHSTWWPYYAESMNDAEEFISGCDLTLIDGHGDTRAEQANCMVGRAPIIVVHDSQHPHTDLGLRHEGYARIDFKDFMRPDDLPAGDVWPWTTVLVNCPERAKAIAEWRDSQ